MTEIKCLENLIRLKEMLLKGEKGDASYFSDKLGISQRTFYRLLYYLESVNNLNIQYNKTAKYYYLK